MKLCNPPYVYSVMYDPSGENYVAALGNGAVCTVRRKTMKILRYVELHCQRIVDAFLCKWNKTAAGEETELLVTASNDLTLGLSLYSSPREASVENRLMIRIENPPNAILFDRTHSALYLADTGNDICRIVMKP